MAYPQTSFVNTEIERDCLIGRRREAVIEQTLRYQLDVRQSRSNKLRFNYLEFQPVSNIFLVSQAR